MIDLRSETCSGPIPEMRAAPSNQCIKSPYSRETYWTAIPKPVPARRRLIKGNFLY